MRTFLLNIMLALAWMVITGSFKPENFLWGFAIAYLILWLIRGKVDDESGYFKKVGQAMSFSLFFAKELVKANLRVAYDVLTVHHHMQPGVVAIPLDVKTDLEITLLANLITLTPGPLISRGSPSGKNRWPTSSATATTAVRAPWRAAPS